MTIAKDRNARKAQAHSILNGQINDTELLDTDTEFPEVAIGLGLTAQIVLLTKQLAEEWLKCRNTELQRSLKPMHSECMKRDLLGDRFVLNGETIVFDLNGFLIDGQHRLELVAKTGKSYYTVVIRGVDPNAIRTIGGGAKRSKGDALKSLGYINTTVLAGAATLVWKYENGQLGQNVVISPVTTEEVVSRHPDLVDSVRVGNSARELFHGPSAAVFCHYVFSRIDEELANHFFERIVSDECQMPGDPELALRRALAKVHTQRDVIALTIKAWNAKRQKRKMMGVRFIAGETFPEIK